MRTLLPLTICGLLMVCGASRAMELRDSPDGNKGAMRRVSAPTTDAADHDVVWETPGKNSADSMPLGNGDIGLNLWVVEDGDLLFYISKTDAWDGDTIRLFPAWPKEWNVEFKLHAPKNTIVEGVLRSGKLEKLQVTPASRQKDVVVLNPN